MVDYITIGIKTLLGKCDIIPSYLRLLSPTRYVYIREELDLIILNKNYCKIEYDLLTNGKKMEDYMEYIGGLVMLVPRIETGYKIDKEYRKIYLPLENIQFRTITQGNSEITLENPIDNVKRLEENIRTIRVLDMLRKKRKEKKEKKEKKKLLMRSNYCGFKWGFLL